MNKGMNMKHDQHEAPPKGLQHANHYKHLLVMTAISFAAMYALMYAMVDALPNVFNNWNQVHMAGLMTAAMVLIELGVMRAMYQDKRLNVVFGGLALLVLVAAWIAIRTQLHIGDQQFLRSMIPHHAGAILMCNEADIRDPEVKALCEQIRKGQLSEIALMKRKLEELEGGD